LWLDGQSDVDTDPIISKYNQVATIGKGEHHGVSFARNRAIDQAPTNIIYPLDCDDRIKPGAIRSLLEVWDGTPLYSDLSKFGDVTIPHYQLLDFTCGTVRKYAGFTSVNVLHTKEQWRSIGGYNENLELYEDGEYNARLYLTFCGVRYPEPLVEYRMHPSQRTQLYRAKASKFAKIVRNMIGGYDMGCPSCGGKRRTGNLMKVNSVSTSVDPNSMDLLDAAGNVLAQYVGGQGRGKHYYEGIATRYMYRVQYGAYIYAMLADTRTAKETTHRSFLVRVERAVPVVQQAVVHSEPTPEIVAQPEPEPEIVAQPEPEPESDEANVPDAVVDDYINLSEMTIVQIRSDERITSENAAMLLEQENNGMHRAKVIAFLEGLL